MNTSSRFRAPNFMSGLYKDVRIALFFENYELAEKIVYRDHEDGEHDFGKHLSAHRPYGYFANAEHSDEQ